MKIAKFLFGSIAAVVLLSGCTTYCRDSGADYLIRPEALEGAPYYTEYEISDKTVSSYAEAIVIFGIFQVAENKQCLSIRQPQGSVLGALAAVFSPTFTAVSNAKNAALYNACEKSGADQLLGLTFEYKIIDHLFYSKVECTAKGFPAKVKGVKMISKKPIVINKWQKIEYVNPYEKPVSYSTPCKINSDKGLNLF